MASKMILNTMIIATGFITLSALNHTLMASHPKLISEYEEHEAIGGIIKGFDCLVAGNCPACTMYAAGGCRGVIIPGAGENVVCFPPLIKPAGTGVFGCATQVARKRCKGVCHIGLADLQNVMETVNRANK